MANDESLLKEVDQDLADEKQWAMFRRYGPAAIGAGLALVVGVGAMQIWNARQDGIAQEQALEYENALELMGEKESDGRAALEAIIEEDGSGYAVLAKFHRAASFAREGETTAAVGVYRSIYEDGGAPSRMRELARLRAGYLSLADGRDAVMTHLGDLPDDGGAFSYHAKEISGLAAIKAEDYETALSIFRSLTIDIASPEPVRTRAEDFAALAESGKAGVNITGETRVDDLLNAIGASANDAANEIEAETGEAAALETGDDALEAVEPEPAEVDGANSETSTDQPEESENE